MVCMGVKSLAFGDVSRPSRKPDSQVPTNNEQYGRTVHPKDFRIPNLPSPQDCLSSPTDSFQILSSPNGNYSPAGCKRSRRLYKLQSQTYPERLESCEQCSCGFPSEFRFKDLVEKRQILSFDGYETSLGAQSAFHSSACSKSHDKKSKLRFPNLSAIKSRFKFRRKSQKEPIDSAQKRQRLFEKQLEELRGYQLQYIYQQQLEMTLQRESSIEKKTQHSSVDNVKTGEDGQNSEQNNASYLSDNDSDVTSHVSIEDKNCATADVKNSSAVPTSVHTNDRSKAQRRSIFGKSARIIDSVQQMAGNLAAGMQRLGLQCAFPWSADSRESFGKLVERCCCCVAVVAVHVYVSSSRVFGCIL